MNILHYGLQRSGTNLLETLLKKNYRICFLNSDKDRSSPLQKHCRLYANKKIIPEPNYSNEIVVESFNQFESLFEVVPDYYLIISKDPYSWYLSYKKWAAKCKWPVPNHHYIEEYNLFYGLFSDLASQSDKFTFVKYIDLIKGVDDVQNYLEKKLSLKRKWFSKLSKGLPRTVAHSDIFTNEKRDYYLNERYLEQYSSEDIETLNKFLDFRVVASLGYELKGAVN